MYIVDSKEGIVNSLILRVVKLIWEMKLVCTKLEYVVLEMLLWFNISKESLS